VVDLLRIIYNFCEFHMTQPRADIRSHHAYCWRSWTLRSTGWEYCLSDCHARVPVHLCAVRVRLCAMPHHVGCPCASRDATMLTLVPVGWKNKRKHAPRGYAGGCTIRRLLTLDPVWCLPSSRVARA
jgi:hypothetical protein